MPDQRPPIAIEALTTERLELTPLDAHADAPSLHAMLGDGALYPHDVDHEPTRTVTETEARLRRELRANRGTSWAIRLRGGDAIGTIGVFADQGTTIRGIGWSLVGSHWGSGIASEAARAAVPYLLAQDGVDGLEAWIDSRNRRSVGVARAAGMSERARLPRVYASETAQTIVMARAAVDRDPDVLGVHTTLYVRDLPATVLLLREVLGLHLAWSAPDPPVMAFLAIAPWTGSPGLHVTADTEPIEPVDLTFEVGIEVDVVRGRVDAAGLVIESEPEDKPWGRREFGFVLPDGHVITVSGPTTPPELSAL